MKNPESWFACMPKIELHLHLEGAIPIDALWRLLNKYGGDPKVSNLTALTDRFNYRSFQHFIETWIWKNGFLREYEDFEFVAEAVATRLFEQNVIYAEIFFSPGDFISKGLLPQKLTQAIRKGLSRVPEVEVALIADLVRDTPVNVAHSMLRELAEVQELGLVGIGIGGSEKDHPPEPFAPVYQEAKELGFRTTAHAGEADGPKSVWSALRMLHVDRIGHGVRAIEDQDLVRYLVAKQIPIEMCPISNVKTGVVGSLKEHPIRHFFDQGALVTVNTDDPVMFGTTLSQEYEALVNELRFSREDVQTLVLNAVRASWMSDVRKSKMKERIIKANQIRGCP